MEGYIALHRKIFEWEWYTDTAVKTFFIHCLLKANFKDKKWRGIIIKRGQFLTSLSSLSNETGLTIKQVRRAISVLEDTNELGKETTNLNTLISVTYYDKYQNEGKQRANEGQTKGKQRATTNNDNKGNKDNKNNITDDKEQYSFEDFWDDYDNKKGRKKCENIWKKLTQDEKLKIKNTVKHFKAYKPFEDYTHPNPQSYLNGKRWEDELPEDNRTEAEKNGWVKIPTQYF